ncbi:hypothetical protein BDY24DRAFT_390272 [Mrakia frigida]|uniref:DUF4149 domain-containing protein n=1 Tax=Mrakia frigida TaxID=29902 RepID=UPI003FCC1EF2
MPSHSTPTSISGSTLLGLFSLQGAHLLVFAWTFGSNAWETCVGGRLAYRNLPRNHFRIVRGRVFLYYFGINAIASTYLLASQLLLNPLTSSLFDLSSPPSFNAFLLGAHAGSYWLNSLWLGRRVTALMVERSDRELFEGKTYTDQDVSQEMKQLNKTFVRVHLVSVFLNIAGCLLVGLHGLWLANYGL